ncbi:MAG: DNA transposition protein, partial [Pseudomonadota bacterium]
ARDTHTINVIRFAALVHATRDWRLLSLLPELFGFAVVDDRYVSLIRSVQIREKADELARLADAEERRARGVGR